MLSNDTKLSRINEKLLNTFGCFIKFENDYNISYKPRLYRSLGGLDGIKSRGDYDGSVFEVKGHSFLRVRIKVEVKGSRVFLVVTGVGKKEFTDNTGFNRYMNGLKKVQFVVDYCNNLGLEVPRMKNRF